MLARLVQRGKWLLVASFVIMLGSYFVLFASHFQPVQHSRPSPLDLVVRAVNAGSAYTIGIFQFAIVDIATEIGGTVSATLQIANFAQYLSLSGLTIETKNGISFVIPEIPHGQSDVIRPNGLQPNFVMGPSWSVDPRFPVAPFVVDAARINWGLEDRV